MVEKKKKPVRRKYGVGRNARTRTQPVKGKSEQKRDKKLVAEPFDWEKAIKMLLTRGKQRGFITEAEVLHALPDLEDNIPLVEKMLDTIETEGIELVDQEVASVWQQFYQEKEKVGGKGGKAAKQPGVPPAQAQARGRTVGWD